MKYTVTEQSFLKEVAEHKLTVLRDDGVYRHLRFAKPQSGDMHFELVTWPNYLAYVGDMGSYVFSRLKDMFVFFRVPENYKGRDGGVLAVNPDYWEEKCQAAEHREGTKKYSADKFRKCILDILADEESVSPELQEAVEDEVLCHADDGEDAARRAVDDFKHGDFEFHDFCETDLQEFTGRYLWCCYAITWGIAQYDALKTEQEKVA